MQFTIHIGLIALACLWGHGSSRGETTIDSLFHVAEQQVGQAGRTKSVKAFRDILSRDDEYAPAYNALANLYLQANTVNDRQRAAQMILKAIMIDPNNPEYRLTRGKIWWAQGFRSRALNQYEDVTEKEPDNTEALDGAGMYQVYEFLALKDGRRDFGKYAQEAKQEAIQVLRKSIQLDGTNQQPYYLLGILYFEDEDWNALQTLMQDLYAQYPDDKNALLFCGLAAYQIGEFNDSYDYYQRALDLMSVEERELLESIDLLVLKEDPASRDTMQTIDDLLKREMFWKSQDPLYLSDFNERKMEHFGRLAYSNLRFRRFSDNVEGWQTDMGKTYIKFGRYRSRKTFFFRKGKDGFNAFYEMRETWFYETFKIEYCGNGGDRWGFCGGYGGGGVSFIPPNNNLFDYWRKAPDNAFRRRTFSFPSTLQEASHHTFRKTAQRFVDPYLNRKYTLPYQVAAFEGRDSVRIELSYMIPKDRLEADTETGEVSFWDGVFLFDEHWNDVYNYRKSVSFKRKSESSTLLSQKPTQSAAAKHRNDHLLVSRMLFIPQGSYRFSVELMDQTSGAIGIARDENQYVYDDETFHLSDLLVGSDIQAKKALPESRDDLLITPNPVRTFSQSEPVFIYLELYDLQRDDFGNTQYEISYTIGKPEVDTLSPTLFASQDLIETMGKTEIDLRNEQADQIAAENLQTGRSQDSEESSSVFPDSDIWGETRVYTSGGQVHHIAAEGLKINRSKDGDLTRTVTANYEGNREDDFTYLQIDVNQVPEGIYQLTVLAKDKQAEQTDKKYVYFRIVE